MNGNARFILNDCIFFDLGWTLEDESKAQIFRAEGAAVAAAEFGTTTTSSRILELQDEGAGVFAPSVFRYALRRIGLDEENANIVERKATWDKSRLLLYPDSKSVLEHFRGRCYLGLLANQSPGTESRLRAYEIIDYFDLILASAELGLAKPDPAIFEYALKQSGCDPAKTWMVGDRIDNDIRPANIAGWHTIRILNGYNEKQQPRDDLEVPDYTVDTLGEIIEIIPT